MTKAPAFPSPIFIAWAHYGQDGWCIIGDWCAELDDAMDYVSEAHESGGDAPGYWKIIRHDTNPDTGLPERTQDVSEEAASERIVWLLGGKKPVPGWLSGIEEEWDEEGYRADVAWHERAAE